MVNITKPASHVEQSQSEAHYSTFVPGCNLQNVDKSNKNIEENTLEFQNNNNHQDKLENKSKSKSKNENEVNLNLNFPVKIKKEFCDEIISKDENNSISIIKANKEITPLEIDKTKNIPIVIKKEFKDITYIHTLSAIADVNKYSSYEGRGRGSDYRRSLAFADSRNEEAILRKKQQKDKQMRKDEKSLQHNLRQAKIKFDAQEREKARCLNSYGKEHFLGSMLREGYVDDYMPVINDQDRSLSYQNVYPDPPPPSFDNSASFGNPSHYPTSIYTNRSNLPLAPLLSHSSYHPSSTSSSSSSSSLLNLSHPSSSISSSKFTSSSYSYYHPSSLLSSSSKSSSSISSSSISSSSFSSSPPIPVPLPIHNQPPPPPEPDQNHPSIPISFRITKKEEEHSIKSNLSGKVAVGTLVQDPLTKIDSFGRSLPNNSGNVEEISCSINCENALDDGYGSKGRVEVDLGIIQTEQAREWREMKRISDMKKRRGVREDSRERGRDRDRDEDGDGDTGPLRCKRSYRSRSRSRSRSNSRHRNHRSDRHIDGRGRKGSRERQSKKSRPRERSRSRSESMDKMKKNSSHTYRKVVKNERGRIRDGERGRERSGSSSYDTIQRRHRSRSRSRC